MTSYIKFFSKCYDFENIQNSVFSKENKWVKYKIYNFIFKENQIIIEWTNALKLLRTIKYLDDLLDSQIRKHNDFFWTVISDNKINKNYCHKGVFVDSLELWEKWKDSSIIKDFKKIKGGVIFNIDFYTKIEYSNKTKLKTKYGIVDIQIAKIKSHNKEFTIISKNIDLNEYVNVRIHYQCETSEIFNSLLCDCREQLEYFMSQLHNYGNSILIYAHEEGRGLGLFNKINAYSITEKNKIDTYNAMLHVASKSENRLFEIPGDILKQMGIKKIIIWTNNPLKIEPIMSRDIKVIPKKIWIKNLSSEAKKYVEDKIKFMGHLK